MMTVLKVTSTPPPLESEKLIPNKNTQENSEKKKKKAHWTKDMDSLFKKGKKTKNKKKNNKKGKQNRKMSLIYLNSCLVLLLLREN